MYRGQESDHRAAKTRVRDHILRLILIHSGGFKFYQTWASTYNLAHFQENYNNWALMGGRGRRDANASCFSDLSDFLNPLNLIKVLFHLQKQQLRFGTYTWLGLSDNEKESDWRWLNGDPLYYTKFNSVEPNGQTVTNCVHMYNSGVWNDAGCSDAYQFLCSSIGTYHIKGFQFSVHSLYI